MGGPYWAGKDAGAWSIPKGEFDEGDETALDAALREFAEELGRRRRPTSRTPSSARSPTRRASASRCSSPTAPASRAPTEGSASSSWSGRRARAGRRPSPRSTARSGSTLDAARERLVKGQRPAIDVLEERLRRGILTPCRSLLVRLTLSGARLDDERTGPWRTATSRTSTSRSAISARRTAFYSTLFGWQIAEPPGFEGYPMWQAPNEISGGGLAPRSDGFTQPRSYVEVDSIDETLAAAVAAGRQRSRSAKHADHPDQLVGGHRRSRRQRDRALRGLDRRAGRLIGR